MVVLVQLALEIKTSFTGTTEMFSMDIVPLVPFIGFRDGHSRFESFSECEAAEAEWKLESRMCSMSEPCLIIKEDFLFKS